MTNINILFVLSAAFIVIGVVALAIRQDVISTRRRSTQQFMVYMIIGGLVAMDGGYTVGLACSTCALIAYFIRVRKFKQEARIYRSLGVPIPEYRKP